MQKGFLLSAVIATGLALAPAALAQDTMKKDGMSKTDQMDQMGKMDKSSDKAMKKTGDTDKMKDGKMKDGMKDGMAK